MAIADSDLRITDVDSATLTGATVTLTNAQAGDVLAAGAMPAGISASAWLPSERGPTALADYANGQGASVVVVPRELEELSGLEALLRGSVPADALEDRAAASIVVV